MGQDHKPPIHLTLVEYSMDPAKGQPLCRTSVCTHFEPNNASIVQKFPPSTSLSLTLGNSLYSEKKKNLKKES